MAAGGPFGFNPGGTGGSAEPAAPAKRIGPREQCTRVFADALAEGAAGADVAPVAEALETAVFDRFPDEKSKDYRSKVKTASQGLKGSRNAQLRQALLAGAITAEDVLSLDPRALEQKAKDAAKSLPPPTAPAPRPMMPVPAAATEAEDLKDVREAEVAPQQEASPVAPPSVQHAEASPPEPSVQSAAVGVVSGTSGLLGGSLSVPQSPDEPAVSQSPLPPRPYLEPPVEASPNLVEPSPVKETELHPYPTPAEPSPPIVNQNLEALQGSVPPAPASATSALESPARPVAANLAAPQQAIPPRPEPSTWQPAEIATGLQAPVGQAACDSRGPSGGAATAVAAAAATAATAAAMPRGNTLDTTQPRSAALQQLKAARGAVRDRRQSAGPSMRNKPMPFIGGPGSTPATPDHEMTSLRRQLEAAMAREQRLEVQLAEQQDTKPTGSLPSTPKGETAANQAVARLTMELQVLQRQLQDEKEAATRREQALEERASMIDAERKDLAAKLLEKASSAGGEMQVRLVEAEAQAAASQREVSDLKAQLEGTTTEVEKLKRHLVDFRRERDELAARHEGLVEKHEDAVSELGDLNAQLKRATDACQRTEKERDGLRHVCREVESQIQAQKQRAQELQRERDNLVLRAAEAAAAPTMVPSRGPSEEELQALRAELASTREELALAHQRLASDSMTTKQKEQRELELTATADRCEQERANAQRREQEAVSALITLRSDLAKVQSQKQTLEVQVASLHQELEMTRRDRRSKVMGLLEKTKQTMASNALAVGDGPVPCSFSTEVPSPAVAVHGLNSIAPPVQLQSRNITNGFQENNHPLGRQPHEAQDASSLFGGPSDVSPTTAVVAPALSVPSAPPKAPTVVGVPPTSTDVLRPVVNQPSATLASRNDPFGAPGAARDASGLFGESKTGASQVSRPPDASGLFGDVSVSQQQDASDLFGTGPAEPPKDMGDPFTGAASAPRPGPTSELFCGGPPVSQQRDASSLFGDGVPTSNSKDASGLFSDETGSIPASQPHDGTTVAQPIDASRPISDATPALQPCETAGLFGGGAAAQPSDASGLFGDDPGTSQPTDASGFFGGDAPAVQPSDTADLFGDTAPVSHPSDASGLFGNVAPASQPPDASGLFGAEGAAAGDASGLFGDEPASKPCDASGLFDEGGEVSAAFASPAAPAAANASGLFGNSGPTQGAVSGAAETFVGSIPSASASSPPRDVSSTPAVTSPAADASGLFGGTGTVTGDASDLFGGGAATDASDLFGPTGVSNTTAMTSPAADASGLFGDSGTAAGDASDLFSGGPPMVAAPAAVAAPMASMQPMQSMPPMQVTRPHQHVAAVGPSGDAASLFGAAAPLQSDSGFFGATTAADSAFGGPVATPAASTGTASKNDVSSLF